MSSEDQKVYTCDRCGAKATVPSENPGGLVGRPMDDLPEGWQLLDGPSGAMPDLCNTCVRAFWQDFMHCAPFVPGELPKRTCYVQLDRDEVAVVADIRRDMLKRVLDVINLTVNRDVLPYVYQGLHKEFDDEISASGRIERTKA